jgi:hypothetical protein
MDRLSDVAKYSQVLLVEDDPVTNALNTIVVAEKGS